MPGSHSGAKQAFKKKGDRRETARSVADMLATPRGRQASQDGRRHSPHGSLSPASTTGSDIPEFQTEDTPHILTKLTEVRNFLAKEISNSTKEVKAEIQALGARTAALEDKMEQITSAHNSVVTHSRTMRQQITDLEMMVEDLANRSRRNNVRLRGLPESPHEGDLVNKMKQYFKQLIPDISDEHWAIDRAHRALRARRVEGQTPRDIILRFHYYSTKEAVMKYARNKNLTYQDTAINLYQDLSPTTLQRRRNWRPLTLLLQEKEIKYTWGHPFKLVAFKSGTTYTLLPGADPKKFLRSLQVEPPPDFALTQETVPELNTLPAEWTTAKDSAGRQH
ncbi:Hypothetical predicted protein [Pelobates cultripes]|uniref:Transposase n=1 Tax=Pelobates cultripes TaxID=61616 RepID=A0AAD1WC01_PELCU|nr:Hypothetical predicted protein [Pelobates cultripes]